MQINLKQVEIELALKHFIVKQGIDLYGKDVSIAFTAGRKESGISADITIEDAEIPFLTEDEQAKVTPTEAKILDLAVVSNVESAAPDTGAVVVSVSREDDAEGGIKTTSLFNS